MGSYFTGIFLIILGYEAVANQTHVGCYLLKCYYFKTKTHTHPAKRKKKSKKLIFIKFVYRVQISFYFQQVQFIPFLVATPLGNTLKTCVLRNEVNGPELVYPERLIKSGEEIQTLLPLGEGNPFVGYSRSNYLKVIF